MAFDVTEKSVAGSQPVELYEFVGTTTTYRYTSNAKDIVSNGDTFTALAGLDRSRLVGGTQEEDQLTLDVSLPFDNDMVTAYFFNVGPPSLELSLYRVHRNDLDDRLLMWKGKIVSFALEGRVVKARVPTIFGYVLKGPCPVPKYQGPCNHVLFDARCGLDASSYSSTRTVSDIDGNVITLDTSPFADDACNAGEMIFAAGGERRMIIDNVSTAFSVNYPFHGLEVGDTVVIRQGCDHSFATCKAKFSNGDNYGGFPLVPLKNPFTKSKL